MQCDVVVLGAGIVGIGVALNLQRLGRDVVLVDRDGPGRGASLGNAGLIEREAIFPVAFPQDIRSILRYSLNRSPEVHYHLSALPRLAPALFRFWQAGRPEALARTIRANIPLYENCIDEHRILARAAGAEALLRQTGWTRAFRSERVFEVAIRQHETALRHGFTGTVLDQQALRAMEPDLCARVAGAIHHPASCSVADPLALTQAYEALFLRQGGRLVRGDARTIENQAGGRWTVRTETGVVDAGAAVLALGPWSDIVTRQLGYRLPVFVQRGYHMHYATGAGATLNHPTVDSEGGYMLTPAGDGIRLTTGVEFAHRDAPATPAQLDRVEPVARAFFPLGARMDPVPWMGCRPCLPDMLPVLGEAPAHKGLWLCFGHAHHGLTLAGSTGRLLAEMMTGAEPFTDPEPYRIDRFHRFRASPDAEMRAPLPMTLRL